MPAEETFVREDLKPLFAGNDIFTVVENLQGEVFRKLEYRKTLAFEAAGKRFFVKIHRGTSVGEIIKNLLQFRLPVVSARNEWLAINRLKTLGVNVPAIAAYGNRGRSPLSRESFIITEDVGTQVNLEDVSAAWHEKAPPFGVKRALISEVARIARAMHTRGICHRDFYICHFLVGAGEGDRLTVIDLHRALVKKNLGRRWVIKDVGSLYFSAMNIGLTRSDLYRFIREYSGKPLKKALKEEQGFWRKVMRRAEKLKSRHPDLYQGAVS